MLMHCLSVRTLILCCATFGTYSKLGALIQACLWQCCHGYINWVISRWSALDVLITITLSSRILQNNESIVLLVYWPSNCTHISAILPVKCVFHCFIQFSLIGFMGFWQIPGTEVQSRVRQLRTSIHWQQNGPTTVQLTLWRRAATAYCDRSIPPHVVPQQQVHVEWAQQSHWRTQLFLSLFFSLVRELSVGPRHDIAYILWYLFSQELCYRGPVNGEDIVTLYEHAESWS